VTVLGREFQVAGAEQRKARLANDVLVKGSDNRVDVAERSSEGSVIATIVCFAVSCPPFYEMWPSDNMPVVL